MFSSKLAGWLAIAAAICFLLLVMFQVSEMMAYRAEPSVWPTSP
jgi:hypothetical protein